MRVSGIGAALILVAVAVLVVAFANRVAFMRPSRSRPLPSVTPVEGPSWLKHLGITMADTHLGQMRETGAAPDTARRQPELAQGEPAEALNETFELTGADLYRINWRRVAHSPVLA